MDSFVTLCILHRSGNVDKLKKTTFAALQCHTTDNEFKDAIEIGFAVIRTLKMKDNFIIKC